MHQRSPVTILTGFLGSGKTTLLNALLREPTWSDSAVIVNELGAIGLDHLLVAQAKENIVLLEAGCICCAVLDSLPETLADLYSRRARGDIPPFRRVLVETTGMADPAPIVRSLMRHPLVTHFYAMRGLICAVDAMFGETELRVHAEARAQVALADRLAVTKTDLTNNVIPQALVAVLKRLNPIAPILDARVSRIPEMFEPSGENAPWLDPVKVAADDVSHGHRHGDDIGAVSLWFDGRATWPGIANWIDYMKERYRTDMLRAKGLLPTVGDDAPVLLHGVQGAFDTKRLATWPDENHRGRLVAIGRNLDAEDIKDSLSRLIDG